MFVFSDKKQTLFVLMGTALSTMLLLTASLAGGVTSSMSANYAREGKWSSVKMTSGITMGVQIALFFLILFIIIKSHTSFLTLPGILISFIIMLIAIFGEAILNMMALIGASSKDPAKSRAFGMSVGAAILSFGTFILSLIIIIFLL